MKYTITGIDIGTEDIKVCVLELDTKNQTKKVIGFFKYTAQGLRKGYVTNEQSFKQTIAKIQEDLARNLGLRMETVALCIGSSSLESIILGQHGIITKADTEVTRFDIEALEKTTDENIFNRSKKLLFSTITEYKIDGKPIQGNPEGHRGVKLEIKKLYIQVLKQQSEAIENAFYENDIEVGLVYPKGICASTIGLTDKQKMVGVAYMDIGAETTVVVVYENGSLIGYTSIPVGSNDITNDIALGLKISLDEAEEVKHGTSNRIFPRKKLEDIIHSRLEDISELTNTYLKKIKKNELLPGGIVLNGGGVEIANIEDYFKQSLNLPVRKISVEISTLKKGIVRQTEYLDCYGIALEQTETEMQEKTKKSGLLIEKIKKNSSFFFKQFLP